MKAATPKNAEGVSSAKKVVRKVVSKAGAPPVLTKSAMGQAEQSLIQKKDDNSKPTASKVKPAGPKPEEADIRIESKPLAVSANTVVDAKLELANEEDVDKNVAIGTEAVDVSKTAEKPKMKKGIVKKKVIVVKKRLASAVSSASELSDTPHQVKVGDKFNNVPPTKQNAATAGSSLESLAGKEEKPLEKPQKIIKKVVKRKGSNTGLTEAKKQGSEASVEKNGDEVPSFQKVDTVLRTASSKTATQEALPHMENLEKVEADEVGECEAVFSAPEELQVYESHELFEEPEDEEDVAQEPGGKAEIAPTRPVSERQKRKKLEVFVGGLDKDATEDDVRDAFQPVGDIMEVRLMMNPATGKNKGYAFVRFATAEQASLAATNFSAMQIRGKECGVLPNQDNDTLFIGNISRDWKSSEVLQKLKEFGVNGIEELTLIGDPHNEALNRGYAFLELVTHYDAVNAFQRLQRPGVAFGYDRPAKVSWAQPLVEADASAMSQVKSVFVDGLSPDWTEDMVKQNFGKFGEIERIVLARNMPSAKRKDFAFVNFSSRESALACVEAFSNMEMADGNKKVKVKVSLTRPLQKGKSDKWSTPRYSGHAGYGRGRAGRGEGWLSNRSGARGIGRGFGRGGMMARSGKRLYDEDEVRMLLKAAREEATGRGRGGRFGRAPRGRTTGGYARNDETQYYDVQPTESFGTQEEAIYSHDTYSRPCSNLSASRGKGTRPVSVRDDYELYHMGAPRGRVSQHTEQYVSPHHRYEQGPIYGRDEEAFVGGVQDYSEIGIGMKRQASAWDEDVFESSSRGFPRARIDYSDQLEIVPHYASHTRSPAGPVAQTLGIRQGRSTREEPLPLFYESGSGLAKSGPTYNDHSYNSIPPETSAYPVESSEGRETSMYSSSLYGGHGSSVGYDLHSSGYY